MATAGGAPPTGASPKPKREFTPEQKRTFAGLGVVGVLALIVGVMYLPGLLSGGSSAPAVPVAPDGGTQLPTDATTNSATVIPTSGPGVNFAGAPGGSVPGSTAISTSPGGVSAQPVVFISRARTDPFQPVYLIPPPAPTPLPPPPPDPEINVPTLPGFEGGINLPAIKDPAVRAAVARPLRIGIPSIPRLENISAPRDPFPLPRNQSEGNVGGAPQQSYDKRLAGIIIGDGVRALLELPSGEQRVVQPGDEVEGIRVLNIERFRQGDRTVSRMLIRDTDGSQRYVELKPSPVAQQAAGGEGGAPGAFGSPR
ncbi:hypothetical protein IAD21_01301 [Abditibacteriota bacterium]|nr:hypothetical protein IAD21_01301 [Abditibacteriota bacterium]